MDVVAVGAVDRGDLQSPRGGDRPKLVDDLRGELARRDEDERARMGGCVGGALDQRDAEGECLARPRRRRREDVDAGERVGQNESLDRERRVDVAPGQGLGHGRAHAERGE